MNMKRVHVFFIVIILIVTFAFAIYQSTRDDADVYEKTLITYLEAIKEGTNKAIEYTAFPNEIIEYDYLHSPMRIADYEVVSATQINEDLYAFILNIAGSEQPEVYTPVYYFVGHHEGKYTVYINANYVPESLHKNFNANDYSYSNPKYLDSNPQFDN